MYLISKFPEGVDVFVCGSLADVPLPHVHVRTYMGDSVYGIEEFELLSGEIGFEEGYFVEGWLIGFLGDIMEAWNQALAGEDPRSVGHYT